MATFRQSMIDQILECPICMETFVKPKVLPCQHSFCLECLYKSYNDIVSLNKNYQLICPICREVYQLKRPKSLRSLKMDDLDARLQNHFVLTSLLEARLNDVRRKASVKRTLSIANKSKPKIVAKCFVCKSDRKWQCVTCDKGFCNECVAEHFDLIPNHEIFDIETQLLCESKKEKLSVISESIAINETTSNDTIDPLNSIGVPKDEQSWNIYCKYLVEHNSCITKALIADLSSVKILSQYSREQFVCTQEELQIIRDHFLKGNEILANGFYVENMKYVVTLAEKNIMFGKCRNNGVFALKTDKTILLVCFIGTIVQSVLARQCIEQVGHYLRENSL